MGSTGSCTLLFCRITHTRESEGAEENPHLSRHRHPQHSPALVWLRITYHPLFSASVPLCGKLRWLVEYSSSPQPCFNSINHMADWYRSQCEKETRRAKKKKKTQEQESGNATFTSKEDGLARSESISTVKIELLRLIHAAYLNLSSLELGIIQLLRLSYDGFPGIWVSDIYLPRSWDRFLRFSSLAVVAKCPHTRHSSRMIFDSSTRRYPCGETLTTEICVNVAKPGSNKKTTPPPRTPLSPLCLFGTLADHG